MQVLSLFLAQCKSLRSQTQAWDSGKAPQRLSRGACHPFQAAGWQLEALRAPCWRGSRETPALGPGLSSSRPLCGQSHLALLSPRPDTSAFRKSANETQPRSRIPAGMLGLRSSTTLEANGFALSWGHVWSEASSVSASSAPISLLGAGGKSGPRGKEGKSGGGSSCHFVFLSSGSLFRHKLGLTFD